MNIGNHFHDMHDILAPTLHVNVYSPKEVNYHFTCSQSYFSALVSSAITFVFVSPMMPSPLNAKYHYSYYPL